MPATVRWLAIVLWFSLSAIPIISFPPPASAGCTTGIQGQVVDLPGGGTTWAVDVIGDHAYVAYGSGGLVIVDLSSRSVVGTAATTNTARDVSVSGDYAYVAVNDGLDIFNVSTPTSPVRIVDSYGGYGKSVQVTGSYALLAAGKHIGTGWSFIRAVDVSDPANPSHQDLPLAPGYTATDLHVHDGYAYLTDANFSPLWMVDVRSLPSMTRVDDGTLSVPNYHNEYGLFAAGAHLYVYGDYMLVFDTSDKTGNPVVVSDPNEIGGGFDACIKDNIAYSGIYSGLLIQDLSETHNPVLVGTVSTGAAVKAVALYGSYVVAVTDADVQVLETCTMARDTDADGVSDDTDACPDTAGGDAVDAHGCSSDQNLTQLLSLYEQLNLNGDQILGDLPGNGPLVNARMFATLFQVYWENQSSTWIETPYNVGFHLQSDASGGVVCHQYQAAVLSWLDGIRTSNEVIDPAFPDRQYKHLLSNVDYGPLQGWSFMHKAAVIYPKGESWQTGRVLDPWFYQRAYHYSPAVWALAAMPAGPDSNLGHLGRFPLTGNPQGGYESPDWNLAFKEWKNRITNIQWNFFAGCKVQPSVTDLATGKRLGYFGGVYYDEILDASLGLGHTIGADETDRVWSGNLPPGSYRVQFNGLDADEVNIQTAYNGQGVFDYGTHSIGWSETATLDLTPQDPAGALSLPGGGQEEPVLSYIPPYPEWIIDPAGRSFGHEQAVDSFDIIATDGASTASWNAVTDDSWIQINPATAGGSGNGTIQYQVYVNDTGAERAGSITVAGKTFEVTQLPEPAPTGSTTVRVNVGPDGIESDIGCIEPSVSADGRYVAFRSSATNLVSADTGGHEQIYVRDTMNGVTNLVSRHADGTPGNGWSQNPSISRDGRWVVFESKATNLTGDGVVKSADEFDVFRHDCFTGETIRVSLTSAGGNPNDGSSIYGQCISDDGRYVAFKSYATNLITGDTNAAFDVFVRDMVDDTTERVSVLDGGGQLPYASGSHGGTISGDGRFVVFHYTASSSTYMAMRDRVANSTIYPGAGIVGYKGAGSISGNGAWVAFSSTADLNIYLKDLATPWDVYATVVSLDHNGNPATSQCHRPVLSDDGRYLAFQTAAPMVAEDTNGVMDVYVRDLHTGQIRLASVSSAGSPVSGESITYTASYLSGNGSWVAFRSADTTLVDEDTNGKIDVFLTGPLLPVHSLTALSTQGGSITPAGRTTVGDGEDALFAIAAQAGHKITDVEVDGASVGAVGEYTFPAVDQAHTILARFTFDADTDGDGLPDRLEFGACTEPNDADSDDDGLLDGVEDADVDGAVDEGETDPCRADSDGDQILDGTEQGLTADDVGLLTDLAVFVPDLDPGTTTDPLLADSDGDGWEDGVEDANRNGRLDAGETDPASPLSNYPPGDVNADGGVDLMDVVLVLQCLTGAEMGASPQGGADVNADDRLDSCDAVFILQQVAGARSTPPEN